MILLIVAFYAYYNLAKNHEKNAFAWGALGAGMYVGFQLLLGVLYGLIYMDDLDSIESNETLLNLLGAVFSIIITTAIYYYLKNNWEKEETKVLDNIDDIGKDTTD